MYSYSPSPSPAPASPPPNSHLYSPSNPASQQGQPGQQYPGARYSLINKLQQQHHAHYPQGPHHVSLRPATATPLPRR